jgi:hypothetical protein
VAVSKPLTALFVDCDSYFASVEQHLDPALRGKPVGVAPVMAESSCCIAASYEAKAFGVKTGTRISDARILCPGIAIVESKPPEYIRYHHQIIEAVENCIHVEAVLSIDEMWAWLPYNLREPDTVEAIGRRIKETVARDVSPVIKVSVGAGPNRYLAKTASKMRSRTACSSSSITTCRRCCTRSSCATSTASPAAWRRACMPPASTPSRTLRGLEASCCTACGVVCWVTVSGTCCAAMKSRIWYQPGKPSVTAMCCRRIAATRTRHGRSSASCCTRPANACAPTACSPGRSPCRWRFCVVSHGRPRRGRRKPTPRCSSCACSTACGVTVPSRAANLLQVGVVLTRLCERSNHTPSLVPDGRRHHGIVRHGQAAALG